MIGELVKFIVDVKGINPIYTNLKDEVTSINQGEVLPPAYDFEAYRLKVNRYIEEHKDHIAIHKLRNNIPLTAKDYEDLERSSPASWAPLKIVKGSSRTLPSAS